MKPVIYFHHKTWCGNICRAKTRATPYTNIDAPPPDPLIGALLWRFRVVVAGAGACGSGGDDRCRSAPKNRRVQQRVPVPVSPLRLLSHYSAAVLLEDTEGQRRLNSSAEYSLETNQEKPRNNNPCPPPWFIVILFHIFLWLLTRSERVVAA